MRILLILLVICLSTSARSMNSSDQKAPRRIHKEIITIHDSIIGFRKEVMEENIASATHTYYVPYTSIESIKKIEITYLDGSGKPLRSESPEINDIQIPSLNFYTCLRAKKIELKEKATFRVKYTSECKDLLLLTTLPFNGSMPLDTLIYEVKVPQGYHLKFDVPYPDMLNYFHVDTLQDRKFHIYVFSAVPRIKSRAVLSWQTEDNTLRRKACMARIIVTPQKFAGNESSWFNTRLLAMYSTSIQLSDSSKALIDSITSNCSTNDSVTDHLINYIRNKIKYLDMEVGYGSFVPDSPNYVLKRKQGDCKGMSNLLCQALRSKGIDAYLALTATIGHSCDMNFPSLIAGDHMICAVKSENDWIFLDPTDKEGIAGQVNPGIQGQTAFIVGYQNGVFIPIPIEKPILNAETFNYRLKLTETLLDGKMNYTLRGGSMESINQLLSSTTSNGRQQIVNEVVRYWIKNSIPSNPKITQTKYSVMLDCDIRFGPSIYVLTPETAYLSFGLLPSPLRFINQDPSGCDILLGHSMMRKVNVMIDFGKDVSAEKYPVITYNEAGFHFDLAFRTDKNLAFIDYTFSCENNIIREQDIPQYRKFETFINSTLKQVIAIK